MATAALAVSGLAACGSENGGARDMREAPAMSTRPAPSTSAITRTPSDTAAIPEAAPLGSHEPAELEEAARAIVAFLRGEGELAGVRLADTVALYLGPEGGGERTLHAREALVDPEAWVVRSDGRDVRYPVAPPEWTTVLTTRVGRHFNCMEYPLSSRFEELAELPHVGTKLEPPEATSCLQSWNITLVFDPDRRPPTLVAALYDQWEW